MSRLSKLFKKASLSFLLSAGLVGGAHADKENTPPATAAAGYCAAYPDFKKPEIPMHRISRNIDPDDAIEERQDLLHKIGIGSGKGDGRIGMNTRMQMREYLLLFSASGVTDFNRDLNEYDTARLRRTVANAVRDAKEYKLSVPAAAAIRLAADRTGVSFDRLAAQGDDIDNNSWLYLVKTTGAAYGLDFFARQIKTGSAGLEVDNPFIHRQILDLKDNRRIAALMTAEYIKRRNDIPVFNSYSSAFSASVREEQSALSTLGFDIGGKPDGIKGTMTVLSVKEFQILHGDGAPTGSLSPKERLFLLENAARAKIEGDKYGIDPLAVGAIRMAGTRNNLDFGYMMELAQAESGFSHNIKASTSSATGLYQFIESTWHYMLKTYGRKYGLGAIADEVEIYMDDYGRPQARINNPLIRAEAIELRKHPHLSALLSTDFQLENKGKEQCYVSGALGRTDMYLAHFMGAHDAVYFINALRQNPDKSAVDTFPEAAEYNAPVFYDRKGNPRSLSEVFAFFDNKFNKGKFEDVPAVVTIPLSATPIEPVIAQPPAPPPEKRVTPAPVKQIKKQPIKKQKPVVKKPRRAQGRK